jgi:uncharacterized protein (TIGR02265 family)
VWLLETPEVARFAWTHWFDFKRTARKPSVTVKPDASARKEPVVFGPTVEALLLHGMKGRLDADARRRLKALGVDVEQPFASAYPVPLWFDIIQVCSEVLHPGMSRNEAWYRVGLRLGDSFGDTLLGKALYGVARVLGPRRMLARMARNLQTSSNYATAQTRELSGGDIELTVEVLPEFHAALGAHPGLDPYFMRGTLETLLEMCGVHNPSCSLQPSLPSRKRSFVFLIPLHEGKVALPERKAPPAA